MRKILALSSLLFIFMLNIALAQPGPQMPPGAMGPMMNELPAMPRLGAALGLTETQLDQLANLRLEMQKKMLPLRSQVVAKRNELKLLLTADKPDMGKIKAKIKEISDIRVQMATIRAEHLTKVRALLDDSQKKKFDAMILSGKGMGGMHHGGMHPHGKKPMGKGKGCHHGFMK